MGITDRLKFIARSYLNAAMKRGRRVLDEAGLDPLDASALTDDELEAEIRRKVEEELSADGEKNYGETAGTGSGRRKNERRKKKRKTGASRRGRRRIAQCYANLELSPGASVDEIHKAWRRLILKYHPDRYPGDKAKMERATRITQIINESYNTLLEHLGAQRQ